MPRLSRLGGAKGGCCALSRSCSISLQVNPDVQTSPWRYSLIYVPNPVIVPGGRFREYYYWRDTQRAGGGPVPQPTGLARRGPLSLDSLPTSTHGCHLLSCRDSFWILGGLLLSNMTATAKGLIQNFLYLVSK